MKFTFYRDNKISQKHQKSSSQILRDFYKTEESKLDMPFERLLLNFISIKYGSFNKFSDKQWNELYIRKDIYNKS